MTAGGARAFFEGAEARLDPSRTRGTTGSYRFDIEGAGSWRVEVEDGSVSVTESDAPADCVVRASEANFMRIVRGEQSATLAYMTGKVRIEGDMGLALKLKQLF